MEAVARESQLSEHGVERTPDSGVRVVVHRRRQQVVVRAGDAHTDAKPQKLTQAPSATPTLIGLDVRERQETLPDEVKACAGAVPEQDWNDDARTLVAMKKRPIVLREGRDELLVQQYRAEALLILKSGIFGDDWRTHV